MEINEIAALPYEIRQNMVDAFLQGASEIKVPFLARYIFDDDGFTLDRVFEDNIYTGEEFFRVRKATHLHDMHLVGVKNAELLDCDQYHDLYMIMDEEFMKFVNSSDSTKRWLASHGISI